MQPHDDVEAVMRQHSKTFYKAFSKLPEEKRRAVFSVYAVCRNVDDAIDVENDIHKLNQLMKKIHDTFEGNVPDQPLFKSFYETITRFPASVEPYMELIDGMRDDYYNRPIITEKDLDAYCYKAAGTVGQMLVPILAHKQYEKNAQKLYSAAITLGKAMQITNILRDVREDIKRGRIYFPSETLKRYDVSLKTLQAGRITTNYQTLINDYIKQARKMYQTFYEAFEYFDDDAIYPILLAAQMYEGILDEIESNHYDNLAKRHVVPAWRKGTIIIKVKSHLKRLGHSV